MPQFFFLLGLYLAGLLFGLPFRGKLPLPFLCLTGFAWGAALWVLAGLIARLLGQPVMLWPMGLFARACPATWPWRWPP